MHFSRPVHKRQHLLLVDAACSVRVNLTRGDRPATFPGCLADGLLGIATALAYAPEAIQALDGLANNALLMTHRRCKQLLSFSAACRHAINDDPQVNLCACDSA